MEVRSPGNSTGSQLVQNSSVWKVVWLVGKKQQTAKHSGVCAIIFRSWYERIRVGNFSSPLSMLWGSSWSGCCSSWRLVSRCWEGIPHIFWSKQQKDHPLLFVVAVFRGHARTQCYSFTLPTQTINSIIFELLKIDRHFTNPPDFQ